MVASSGLAPAGWEAGHKGRWNPGLILCDPDSSPLCSGMAGCLYLKGDRAVVTPHRARTISALPGRPLTFPQLPPLSAHFPAGLNTSAMIMF